MTATTQHALAAEYLARLRKAAKPLPKQRRADLMSDIEQHLADSLGPDASEAEVRTVLDRLGDPEQIVLAEEPSLASAQRRRGVQEWAAILLLPFGGLIIPVIGWLVGVLLLWTSEAWTLRDKLIGTLVPPGGYMVAAYVVFFGTSESGQSCTTSQRYDASGRPVGRLVSHCTGSAGGTSVTDILVFALGVGMLILPMITAIYLARRARRTELVAAEAAAAI